MKLFFSFLFLAALSCCKAQYRERLKESSFDPASFEEFTIELKKKKKEYPWVVDFSKTEFIDCRSDTSKLGFVMAGQFNDYHRVIFPQPTAAYLSETMQKFYNSNPDTKENVAFVLKHLWVSERLVTPATYARSLLIGSIDYLSFCYVNVDCYAESNGQYKLIGKIDTVVSVRKWIVNAADDLIKKTFFEAISKANVFFKNRNNAETSIDRERLIANYKSGFDFPVLKAANLTKGVYLNYNEFLNNNPSVKGFEVVKTKKTEIIKSENIADSVLARSWGYSDGTTLNIRVANNYYRAVRLANTFEIAGPRELATMYSGEEISLQITLAVFFQDFVRGGLIISAMGGHNRIMKELVPYQLNIKEGTLY